MENERDEEFEDYRAALCRQADELGMESLTEQEQCIVNREKFVEY